MTESTISTEDLTPEQAEADLAKLEQSVIDGGAVTVDQITQAKERISFARLIRQGKESRAEKKILKEADEAREAAKAEVTKLLTTSNRSIESIHAAAIEALDKFLSQLADHNALVESAGRILDRANVVHPNPGLMNPLDAPGLDPDFYVNSYGGAYNAVRANGVTFQLVHAGSEFRRLVFGVANVHKLTTRGNSNLAYKIGRD